MCFHDCECHESGSLSHCHHHDHTSCQSHKVTWKLVAMILLTGLFFFAELLTGYITHSLSMQSDAMHMFSDEASLIIGLLAHHFAKKPETDRMSFGWARAEVLGGLVNATFLLAVCLSIFIEACERLMIVHPIHEPDAFIIVGFLGLLVNVIGIMIFHNHHDSDNLHGIFLHILGDLLGSVGVMISAIVVKFTEWKYKYYLDPIMSLFIVAILVKGSLKLFMKTAKTLLEATPESVDLKTIRETILSHPNVESLHELHVWEISRKHLNATVHVVLKKGSTHPKVRKFIEHTLADAGICNSTVQTEIEGEDLDSSDEQFEDSHIHLHKDNDDIQ